MASDTITAPVRPGSAELAALLERVAAGSEEREREGRAPHDAIAWIKEAGLGRLRIPVAEGGGGATVRELFATLIALAEADANVAHVLRVHFSFVEQQLAADDPARRARWLALVNEGAIFGNGISEHNDRPVGGLLATTPEGTLAAVTIPLDREGVSLEDDWDGFGQRLTGTGTTRLADVRVRADEVVDLGAPDADDKPPSHHAAFLQLYLQAVTAGVLRSVRNDAVSLVGCRRRSFSHAGAERPADDRQVLQVVGEIAAEAFAAEAIVLHAADAIGVAAASVRGGLPDPQAAREAQVAAAQAKVAVDGFAAATAARLFDVGGASATRTRHNLDRHWRNVRTISTHNPAFLKASAVGDWFVNGTAPPLNGFF